MKTPSRYIDLTTAYGFKRVFGTDVNKDLLIDFLNELFQGKKVIKDLTYNKNEQQGDTAEQGLVIFDLTCTSEDDSQFIIEVQRSKQNYFKERTIYYGSKLISDQAPKGSVNGWNYAITEVYVIAIMDGFHFSDSKEYLHDICLFNQKTGQKFYDRLAFIYIELLNFNKPETVLESDLDKWLFVLKNMARLDKLPTFLKKPVFQKLFQIAEYSNLNKGEKQMYDVSLKRKWDEYAVREYWETEGMQKGIEKGIEKGIQKGIQETQRKNALNMLNLGLSLEIISKSVDLPIDEIKKLCSL
ncbi:Rpn family recombination-promoting nuclease/putative transposase [Lonepinella sp. BR2474]|uniref:Rpn family recombination-promoting nuclease/putative transposase n=1 Tax=Lonepinella sp. BR2474 TaxID=3434548 RepID=UPI003F6E1FB4